VLIAASINTIKTLNPEWTYRVSIKPWRGYDFVECQRAGHLSDVGGGKPDDKRR
jgi:hypothetical protein